MCEQAVWLCLVMVDLLLEGLYHILYFLLKNVLGS